MLDEKRFPERGGELFALPFEVKLSAISLWGNLVGAASSRDQFGLCAFFCRGTMPLPQRHAI
jgi:hypothetical protein